VFRADEISQTHISRYSLPLHDFNLCVIKELKPRIGPESSPYNPNKASIFKKNDAVNGLNDIDHFRAWGAFECFQFQRAVGIQMELSNEESGALDGQALDIDDEEDGESSSGHRKDTKEVDESTKDFKALWEAKTSLLEPEAHRAELLDRGVFSFGSAAEYKKEGEFWEVGRVLKISSLG